MRQSVKHTDTERKKIAKKRSEYEYTLILAYLNTISAGSSFDLDVFFLIDLLRRFLRDRQVQNTVFEFSTDIFLSNCLAYIEAAGAVAVKSFSADISAFFVLFFG